MAKASIGDPSHARARSTSREPCNFKVSTPPDVHHATRTAATRDAARSSSSHPERRHHCS
eukprot:scaffold82561_cov57-Phaeocystis_antarctica.AAC.4